MTARSLLIGYAAGVLVSGSDDFLERVSDASHSRARLLAGQVSIGGQLGRARIALAPGRRGSSGHRRSSTGPRRRLTHWPATGGRLRRRRGHDADGDSDRDLARVAIGGSRMASITGHFPLLKLAARSAARNPGRSTLTIALIATASFLIVAMSAFQLQPTETGTGGFTLVGESSQPIYSDLNSELGREELLGDQAAQLKDARVYALRVRPGDDASCGNLYKTNQPRILGVPPAFVRPIRRRRDWRRSSSPSQLRPATNSDTIPGNCWPADPTPLGEPIPVVIDQETAMYSLQLYGGIGEEFTFTYDGRPITFRVVGLLSLSILHGNLLISESDFRRLFPSISGYRYFLIETPAQDTADVADVLEDRLGDQGFDATDSHRILAGLMTLQNTYLRTFQSLGALGLLLGTLGLAAVQMRSVLERRGEMGLLRASGFRRRRLSHLVLLENIMLLLAGLATGVVAALLAVVPHMFGGGASVPFQSFGVMLLIVFIVGIIAGTWAARATLRVPLLAALREER